ncbi:MAG TPA: hypothetical protein DEB70_03125 [Planctomycetaceae bacterium]|nr:hypothetical protein [Planctomycetaceae bacterium]
MTKIFLPESDNEIHSREPARCTFRSYQHIHHLLRAQVYSSDFSSGVGNGDLLSFELTVMISKIVISVSRQTKLFDDLLLIYCALPVQLANLYANGCDRVIFYLWSL